MTTPIIVGTGPLRPIAREILQPFGEIVIMPDYRLKSLFPLRGDGTFTEEALAAAPHLKVLGRTGVGYDKVCVAAATARSIPVVFTPDLGARAVAEGAMTWMPALSKNIIHWDTQFKAGNWYSREELTNDGLEGATLGIIGFGRIGPRLAKMATPFDMTILAYDPYVADEVADLLL